MIEIIHPIVCIAIASFGVVFLRSQHHIDGVIGAAGLLCVVGYGVLGVVNGMYPWYEVSPLEVFLCIGMALVMLKKAILMVASARRRDVKPWIEAI